MVLQLCIRMIMLGDDDNDDDDDDYYDDISINPDI